MFTQTPSLVSPASAVDSSTADLIERAAGLKRELVAFAQSPRFARRLDALLLDAADDHGRLDEVRAVFAIDRFALQHRLPDGRTVVERFVTQRRPPLLDDDRTMVLGWRDVVEGCFEVRRSVGDAVEIHNLLDDVVYRVHSNMGRGALKQLRLGMFAVCRIVPLHPATDAWLISGHVSMLPKSARRQVAAVALQEITAHPELMRRNPDLLRRAWEMQAEQRANFIEVAGADVVVQPPHEAQETLREHYRRLRQKALARLEGKAAERVATHGLEPDEIGRLPEELLHADSVGLVFDEIEGLNYYRDFGLLDELFADPALARDRGILARVRSYLRDDSVSPLAIRRLVQRHPDGADPVFRALLRKPGFSWSRDGEALLRREKTSYFDREPTPSVSVIGGRLNELLGIG